MVVLNSLFPVFSLLVMGSVLRKYGLTGEMFLKTSDRLVYYIFFPLLLFWKIGGADTTGGIPLNFCAAAAGAVLLTAGLSIAVLRLAGVSDFGAGAFSQSCYRFNTYIGVAVIANALGPEGIRYFGILIALVIPLINVIAVSTLIWYSGRHFAPGEKKRLVLKAVVSNPLILACVAGILYAGLINRFPMFLDNSFRLMATITLPLALLSIGGSLTFRGVKAHLTAAILSAAVKLLILPAAGFLLLTLFQVTGLPYRVAMIFFALPTSTAIYVLSSQLNSDTELASAAIVMSTVLSMVSLSAALLL